MSHAMPQLKYYIPILASVILIIFFSIVSAASKADIIFPVKELGNCKSEIECKVYCEKPGNMIVCVNFAEKHGLISKGESEKARKFEKAGMKGPGGCTSAKSCENYCNTVDHIDECLAFAEKNNFVSKEELKEIKQVKAALAKGAKLPGGCTSKESCEAYCEDPIYMEECFAFAEAAGFLAEDEREEAKKVMEAMKKGIKPPPCRGKQACDNYCSNPQNMEMCVTFAEAAELIPADELQDAKKFLQAVKKGIKPPACNGRAQCDVYCRTPEHMEECLIFAEAAGFMSEEELEGAKMMLTALKKGVKFLPCMSKEACDDYCSEEEHREECMAFAEAVGFITPEDREEIEEGKMRIQEELEDAPEEVIACMEEKLGVITITKLKAGTIMPSEKIGNAMRLCFEAEFGGEREENDFGEKNNFEEGLERGFERDFEGNFNEFEEFENDSGFDDVQGLLNPIEAGKRLYGLLLSIIK